MTAVHFVTTGGTIDKEYSVNGELVIGAPMAPALVALARTNLDVSFTEACRKDSLELTDSDISKIRSCVIDSPATCVVVTHGTDTMVRTGRALGNLRGKTVVLTGAMQPARMRESDAATNIGLAVAAVQLLPDGVYVAMSGLVIPIERASKNVALGLFEFSDDVHERA